jgi:hypothetical protein
MSREGVVVSHEGSWRAGVNGARAGVIMPGIVLLGARYMQEIALGVDLAQAEIVGLHAVVDTPGTFAPCLQIKETNALEPGAAEFKWYAPGIGLVQEGGLKLVKSTDTPAEEAAE